MSEPNAGTDVLGLQTKATQDESGNWVLNGTKMWITVRGSEGERTACHEIRGPLQNADSPCLANVCLIICLPLAQQNGTLNGTDTGDVFLIYSRTGPGRTDVTQFIVEKNMPGFTLGQQIKDKLGMRASMTAELVLDHVVVPPENVVGQVNQATLCMMRNLEVERIGLAAMAVGIARRCLDEMKLYASERKAFGKDLYAFGQVQRHLAESYAEYMAGRTYLYAVANGLDLTTYGNGLDADGTKLYCANMAKNVADRAIQVMGGNGYVGEYKVERFWRDAKLLEIGGGTNESHHKNMARDLKKMGATPLE